MEEVVYVFCGGGFEGHAVGEERAGSVCEGGAEGFHFLFLWVCFPSIFFFFFLLSCCGGWFGMDWFSYGVWLLGLVYMVPGLCRCAMKSDRCIAVEVVGLVGSGAERRSWYTM